MKTTKDFERRNAKDNQLQIKLDSGSEIAIREGIGGIKQVTSKDVCTKNGGNKFYISDEELRQIIE